MGDSGWDMGRCGHELVAFDSPETMNRIRVGAQVDRCADCARDAEPSSALAVKRVLIGAVVVRAWFPREALEAAEIHDKAVDADGVRLKW